VTPNHVKATDARFTSVQRCLDVDLSLKNVRVNVDLSLKNVRAKMDLSLKNVQSKMDLSLKNVRVELYSISGKKRK